MAPPGVDKEQLQAGTLNYTVSLMDTYMSPIPVIVTILIYRRE